MITKLRKRLHQESLPNYKVAGAMGIHGATMSMYALGRKEIAPHHLILMCRYWQCDPAEIIGYLDEDDIINWVEENTKQVSA